MKSTGGNFKLIETINFMKSNSFGDMINDSHSINK